MNYFFSKYKFIFYLLNIVLIILYLFPGSILGWFFYGNLKLQPQITSDFLVSTNHLYAFFLLSLIGLLTYKKQNKLPTLFKYLFLLGLVLELMHLIIPIRSFEFSDLFGNFLGVLIIILSNNFIPKYDKFKK
jgi:hypothetical protein